MAAFFFGIDLGGTYTKVGLCDERGMLVDSLSFASAQEGERLACDIGKGMLSLVERNNIAWAHCNGMCIGCPAPIAAEARLVSLTNLPIKDFDLQSAILRHIGRDLPSWLINDADAAALAEARLGAGIGFDNIVLVTLGTGIGGGIIIDGKLYRGSGAAGEIGHMQIVKNGRRCGCGQRGCLETYASTNALIRAAQKYSRRHQASINFGDGQSVFASYLAGEAAAREAVIEFASYLSIGIKNIVSILSPQLIILGGGISKQGDRLLSLIPSECIGTHTELKCARFDNEAGMIGAALFGLEAARQK